MIKQFNNISRFAFTMLLATFFQIAEIQAQPSAFWHNNWFVGVSPGAVSYFGDLSEYDYNPIKKLLNESGPAISFTAGKNLKNYLEFGLVATLGKVSVQRTDWNMDFKNQFNEFGVYSALSIADVVAPRRKSRFDYGLTINYSLMQWRSVMYSSSKMEVMFSHGLDPDGNKSGNGETTHHFGGGYFVAYVLNSNFSIRLSQTIQILNTDYFDSFEGLTDSGINDRIILSGIGLIFSINRSRTSGPNYQENITF